MATLRELLFARRVRTIMRELLIVFVGVVAAFQVDRWNERRATRAMESDYLDRLTRDVEADVRELDRIQGAIEQRRTAAERVIRLFEGQAVPKDTVQLLSDLRAARQLDFFRPRAAAFQDLVSTGRLGLVRNTSLRDSLVAYHNASSLRIAEQLEQVATLQVWGDYLKTLGGLIDLRMLEPSLRTEAPGSPAINVAGLLRSEDLRQSLENFISLMFRLDGFYQTQRQSSSNLLDALQMQRAQ